MRRTPLCLVPALLGGCTGLPPYSQGPLQPQSVAGPCQVGHFFLLGYRSVPTTMTVANTGQACSFDVVNPALNAVIDAALLSGAASHGQASAAVVNGRRQVAVGYVPAPGYAGRDRFSVTLEPDAVGITVDVTVAPGGR